MSQEVAVCSVSELSAGQMKQFSVAETDILLAHIKGEFYATGAYCTHYGAPLETGVLQGTRAVCPWHNACYDLTTGDHLEPPGCNALTHFATQVKDGQVWLTLPDAPELQRVPEMVKADTDADGRTFVIIGGGAAGQTAAEGLRQAGFKGRVLMLTEEAELPYDRTKLSKATMQNGDANTDPSLLRSPDFYATYGIEVQTGQKVSQVDPAAKAVYFEDGRSLSYAQLLVATGGQARQLDLPGADLAGVFTLRRVSDLQQILQTVQSAQQAVIIGSSFIGMEAASSLAQRGLSVTVVSPDAVPFEKILGAEVGQLFQKMHEEHGVQFRLEMKATEFKGGDTVESVTLESGDTLPADLVIIGVGVKPATDFLSALSLHEKDQSVPVNQYLQATDGIYAAGDIARFPDSLTGEPVRIEHWRLAEQHGKTAALNMAGEPTPFSGIPFFWTGQFDLKMRYVGHAEDWDDLIVQGSLEDRKFLAFYCKANQVRAVAGCGRDRDIAAISELMRLRQMPAADSLRQADSDWTQKLAS